MAEVVDLSVDMTLRITVGAAFALAQTLEGLDRMYGVDCLIWFDLDLPEGQDRKTVVDFRVTLYGRPRSVATVQAILSTVRNHESLLDRSLEHVMLPVSVVAWLASCGVVTVGQLVDLPVEDYQWLPGGQPWHLAMVLLWGLMQQVSINDLPLEKMAEMAEQILGVPVAPDRHLSNHCLADAHLQLSGEKWPPELHVN